MAECTCIKFGVVLFALPMGIRVVQLLSSRKVVDRNSINNQPPEKSICRNTDRKTQDAWYLVGCTFAYTTANQCNRDCAYMNLMMDASSIFPVGFHPARVEFLPDLSNLAKPLSRQSHS